MVIIKVIIKDLKVLLSDKKAMAVMLLMPLVLMTILSLALKGSFSSGDEIAWKSVNIAVVKKYDRTTDIKMFKDLLSSDFLKKGIGEDTIQDLLTSIDEVDPEKIFFKNFLESSEISEIIKYSIEDENKAAELLENNKISAIVILPEKYIYDMNLNLITPFRNKIDIKILTHPDRNIDGRIVKSVIEAYSNAISSVIIGKNVLVETSLANNTKENGLKDLGKEISKINSAAEGIKINIENVAVKGRNHISSSDYYAAAMMTMFILFAAGNGGRMLLEEKDNKTYQRMIIAGTSSVKILTGKFITIFLIAVIQIAVMIVYSHYGLRVQWGNINLVVLISLAASFAVAGVGAFIAALTYKSGNYKMANIFESVIIQGMALLGGSFFPIDVMPAVFQKLSFISLNGIALKSYLKVMVGYGIDDIKGYIITLLVMGVIFSILSVLTLKEKEVVNNDKYNKAKTVKA